MSGAIERGRRRPRARSSRGSPGSGRRGLQLLVRPGREEGFSLVETMLAITLVFGVVLALLNTLNTGVQGLLTGRQRGGAVAVAKEYIELARSTAFSEVGHDIENDGGLLDDPEITGTHPELYYEPDGASAPEQLVAGTPTALFPVHQPGPIERDGSVYHVTIYVTWVDNLVGDDYKRLTVFVEHGPDQYGGAIDNVVRLSTYIARTGVASPSETSGVVDVEAGRWTATGTLDGVPLQRAELFLPLAHSDVSDGTLAESHGVAQTGQLNLELTSGTPSGCDVSGSTATCSGIRASTYVDDDGSNDPSVPLHQTAGPTYASGESVSYGSLVVSNTSDHRATSKSTVESCSVCSPAVGDGDGLPYTWSEGLGSDEGGARMDYEAGASRGELVAIASPGATVTAEIDADPVTDAQQVTSTSASQMAAIDVVRFDGDLDLPSGLDALALVSATDVTSTAQAGPGVAAPGVSGSTITVSLWDETSSDSFSYVDHSFDPGQRVSASADGSFSVTDPNTSETATVTFETTLQTERASTSCDPTSCTDPASAEVRLDNWLVVKSSFTVVQDGTTMADLVVRANYGRVNAQAGYSS